MDEFLSILTSTLGAVAIFYFVTWLIRYTWRRWGPGKKTQSQRRHEAARRLVEDLERLSSRYIVEMEDSAMVARKIQDFADKTGSESSEGAGEPEPSSPGE